MASATELERLVVKLVGDDSDYQKTLKHAEQATRSSVGAINNQLGQSAKQFNTAGREIDQMGRYVKSSTGALGGFGSGLAGVGQQLSKVGAGISSMGRKLTLFVTGPLAAFAAFSVKAYSDFDSAMTKSTAIMSGVTDSLRKDMETTAMALSGSTITAPKDLADAYFFLASAGFDATESIAALDKVNNFAIAGMFDMATATDLLTDAQSALGLNTGTTEQKMRNMVRVSDAMVRANTLANATVEQFSIALTSKAGASMKAFNKDVEEGLAVLAAFADQGVKAQLAGNQLDRIIRLLSKSSSENADAHKELGFRVFDAQGKMRNLGDIVGNLEGVLEGMSDELKVATLAQLGFDARVQQAILPLLGTSGAIKKYEEQLRSASGFTKDVAGKQMASFASQMKILKNQITIVATEVGAILAPALLWINEKIKIGIKWWRQLSDTTKKWIVGIAAAVAAIGPLLVVIGGVIAAIGSLVGIVAFFVAIGWEVVLIAAAVAVGIVVWIAQIAAVVAAIGGLIYWLIGPEGINAAWTAVVDWVKNAVMKIVGFIANLSTNIKIFLKWFPKNWQNVLKDMIQLWVLFHVNMIKNAFTILKTLFRLWVALQGWFSSIFKKIFSIDFLKWIWAGIKAAAKAFLNFAKAAWKAITGIFKKKGKKVKMDDFIGQMDSDFEGGGKDFLGTAKGILQDGLGDMKGPFEGFKSSIEEGPKFVYDMGKKTGEAAAEGIKTGAEGTAAAAEAITTGPSEAFLKLMGDIKKFEQGMVQSIATWGMSSREIEIWKLQMRGATEQQLKQARALDKHLTKLEDQKKLMTEGKNLTKSLMTPQEKYTEQIAKYQELLDGGAINQETFNRAMEKAHKELKKDFKVKFNVSGIQSVEAGTAEAMARLEEFRALKPERVNLGGADIDPPKMAGPVKFDDGAKVEAKEAVGKVTVGTSSDRAKMVDYLMQIAENTKVESELPRVVLQEANI